MNFTVIKNTTDMSGQNVPVFSQVPQTLRLINTYSIWVNSCLAFSVFLSLMELSYVFLHVAHYVSKYDVWCDQKVMLEWFRLVFLVLFFFFYQHYLSDEPGAAFPLAFMSWEVGYSSYFIVAT